MKRNWLLAFILSISFASPASANSTDRRQALLVPLKCMKIAALSYADQPETAKAITQAAAMACDSQIRNSVSVLWKIEKSKGTSMREEDVGQILRKTFSESVEPFVMQMRAEAKRTGNKNFYEEAAQRLSKSK